MRIKVKTVISDSEIKINKKDQPELIDQEVMTIYLYIMRVKQRLKIKQMHGFDSDYLCSWFLLLPSYEAFHYES
jgi:hypothetical protein